MRYYLHIHLMSECYWANVQHVKGAEHIINLSASALDAEALTMEQAKTLATNIQRFWPGAETISIAANSRDLIPAKLRKIINA